MYIDTKFNSLLTALANVYVNLTTTSMKMHNHIRSMNIRPSETLVRGCILVDKTNNTDLVEQVFSLQFTLTRSHLKAWPGSICNITENQIRWHGPQMRELM